MEDKPTYEELERRIRELTALSHEKDLAGKITRTLFDISNAVNTTHDIDDLYRSIYYSLNRLMNLKNFFIAIHSETDDTLRVPFYVDEMDIDVLDSRPLPKKNSLTGEVFLKGEPLFLTQKMLKKRAAENRIIGTPPKIWLGIPLKRDRKVLGIIATQSYDDPKYFSKRDLDILTMVSHQIATVIDKKHSQNQLDQLRNYLYNIINSMPSVLVVVDKQGKITQWNLQAELETGVNADQALGKTVETVFPRLAEHMDQVQDAIQSRKIKTRLKQKYQSNGKIRFEDIIIYPLISPGDKGKNIVDGVVIRVDDITDQAAMEEMMIQSEKMMSVGGLAAGMAHEINNPLAGMMQNAQVIYNRLSKDIPANQTAAEETGITLKNIRDYCEKRQILEKLDMINKTGIRSANLVKNMLSFSRKSDTLMAEHDISKILIKTITLSKSDYNLVQDYDFKQIKIVEEFDPDLPLVPCSRSKIQLVFLNILKNGAEAMFGIKKKSARPQFILRTYMADDMACIEIEDNGPGLDDEAQRHLFEPFFTTKPVGQGTGLGLSVSYFIIVTDHNGKMAVESTPFKQTKFIIKLPYSAVTL